MTLNRLDDALIPQDLGEFYDDVALRTDALQRMMYRNPDAMKRFDRVVQLAAQGKRGTCLELGCSEGMMTRQLAVMFKRVDAVEISSVALGRCPDLENVRYYCADAATFQPPRKSYDVVVASEIFEHMRDPKAMIERYTQIGRRLLVTGPITEPVNTTGAFDASMLGREQRQGDATGHIWYMDWPGFLSWFDGVRILAAEKIAHSGLVICESAT